MINSQHLLSMDFVPDIALNTWHVGIYCYFHFKIQKLSHEDTIDLPKFIEKVYQPWIVASLPACDALECELKNLVSVPISVTN